MLLPATGERDQPPRTRPKHHSTCQQSAHQHPKPAGGRRSMLIHRSAGGPRERGTWQQDPAINICYLPFFSVLSLALVLSCTYVMPQSGRNSWFFRLCACRSMPYAMPCFLPQRLLRTLSPRRRRNATPLQPPTCARGKEERERHHRERPSIEAIHRGHP